MVLTCLRCRRKKVGSHECEEGQIFIEPQGFCVMAGIGVKEGLAEKALESVKTGWIQNMALFFYSRLTHTITLNWVKFHLTRKATKKMPVSSATTIHGFPLPKLFWDTATAPLKFIKNLSGISSGYQRPAPDGSLRLFADDCRKRCMPFR